MGIGESSMKGLAFDIKGSIAHFRKPDTTATQMTYPFITPTAAKGLVGAVLGMEDFVTKDKIGIKLLNPVQIVSQQMSMLGKDAGPSFNRPTTIELVVNPAYRIYYAGNEYVDKLREYLEKNQAVYPTYLGSAYALTKPILVSTFEDNITILDNLNSPIETETVVPTVMIESLQYQEEYYYCRAGGFMYEYKGERRFEKSIDFIYEQDGKKISFFPAKGPFSIDVEIAWFGDEVVCLF